ncbi:hypothetical protein C8J57DRAFT_1468399 [Mycena rebaudengoi]|nr:hypothetical protein C8J57DRAFT_1468399 [Mycena rebaudengoi]
MAHIRKHPAAARPQRRGVVSQARTRAVIPAGDTRQRALVCAEANESEASVEPCSLRAWPTPPPHMRRARRTAHRHFKAHAGILIARATRHELCIDLGKIGYGWGLALELCSMKGIKFPSMCSQ